jgi:hypothetical protein
MGVGCGEKRDNGSCAISMSEESLEDWLGDIRAGKADTIDFSFPSERLRNEYIAAIEQRPDSEIEGLIRRFLIPSGSFGADEVTFHWLIHLAKDGKPRHVAEFQRRLVAYVNAKVNRKRDVAPPWEGSRGFWICCRITPGPRSTPLTHILKRIACSCRMAACMEFPTQSKSFAQNTFIARDQVRRQSAS